MNITTASWNVAAATMLPASQPSRRLYFFEERLPVGARNISFVHPAVKKHGVVLDGDAPWERGGGVSGFCGSVVRLDDGRLRLYYTTTSGEAMRLAVAESDDGLCWERLPLGQERDDAGRSTNRIVLHGVPPDVAGEGSRQGCVGQPQVLRLPDGRWRMYYWHHQHPWGDIPYRYTIAESDDGLQWHVPHYDRPALISHWIGDVSKLTAAQAAARRAIRSNDAVYVYANPRLGIYEAFSQWFVDAIPERRVAADNCPDYLRMIQRRVSADGLVWSAPELVIQADANDPWDQQFYHLAVQYHDQWLIGSLGHYRVEADQQTTDLELVFSRDGRRWERPLRAGFIPRESGGRDAEGIYPANAWINRGDNWLALYMGTGCKHGRPAQNDQQRACIMAASWPKHRFVGLRAGRGGGGFMTPVFYLTEPGLLLDADIRGWLRAELCDAWGRKLSGFSLGDAVTLSGDSAAHRLSWREAGLLPFLHEPLRLRFEYSDADVFSLCVAVAKA